MCAEGQNVTVKFTLVSYIDDQKNKVVKTYDDFQSLDLKVRG